MQSGRKPKPTAVKALEGNPGKRSLNTGEPKPEKKGAPLSGMAGGRGKKGMEADGGADGEAGHPYGD